MKPRESTLPSREIDRAVARRESGFGEWRVVRRPGEVGVVSWTAGERRGPAGTEAVRPSLGDDGVERDGFRCIGIVPLDSAERGRVSISRFGDSEMVGKSKQPNLRLRQVSLAFAVFDAVWVASDRRNFYSATNCNHFLKVSSCPISRRG